MNTRLSWKKGKLRNAIWALAFSLTATAQVPVPAKAQQKPIALVGGVAHLGTGLVIENAVIAFSDGKLTIVAAASSNPDLSGYETIDVNGKHVYPGFILPDTDLGLVEVSSLPDTNDNNETGDLNPNVRSLIAYNTDSELTPTLRFNGILLAQITPVGGVIPGTSSIVELDAWNWEDAAYQVDDAIHLNWPDRISRRFDFSTFSVRTEPNKNYDKTLQSLEKLFLDAISYGKLDDPVATNLKLAAMAGLFDGSKQLFLHDNDAKGMIEGVKFAKKHGVQKIVIVGGSEAYLIADFLKEERIPIVLNDVHRLPPTPEDDVDLPYKLPYLLHREGISFCLGYGSRMSGRNLAFFAGTAAAYGLNKEIALAKITSATAEILGIGDRVGSLEVGKDATLFVSGGDALDMRTQNLEHAFIRGKKIVLSARQQALFERYKQKYGQ